jgi:predicted esterase
MRLAAVPGLVVAVAVLCAAAGTALGKGGAKGKPAAGKPPAWSEEAGTFTLEVFDPPLRAFVQPPATAPEEGKRVELVITLHGHGGNAQGLLGYMAPVAGKRGAYCMACQGSGTVAENGGHSWSPSDAPGVLACLDAALAKFPIDPKRVVVSGHSAGGAMSFHAYVQRPSAFAGIYVTATAGGPTSQHQGARVVVNLGTRDGNWSLFQPSVAAAEKSIVGRIVGVQDLGHELPHETYSDEAVAWLFDSKAPSETLRVPAAPDDPAFAPDGTAAAKSKGGAFRHELVFQAGGRGAPADALKRADAKAKALALRAKATAAAAGAFDAIAADNQDPLTQSSRGAITGAVLARYGGALMQGLSKLGPGDVSPPLESDAGWHLVLRDR